jgi:ABC-type molybdate transport system permease subunit
MLLSLRVHSAGLAWWISLLRHTSSSFVYCVIILCVFLLPDVYGFTMCVLLSYMPVAGLLARSHYPEGPANGHLGTGFSWFPSV